MKARILPFLFLLTFLFGIIPAMAQEGGFNRSDGRGRKQGSWQKFDSAGHKIYEGSFRDNIPVDTFRYYYPDGKLKTLSVFSENGRRVKSVSYFKNGQPMATGMYFDEKKDSTWQFFSEYNGILASEENYAGGVRDGTSKLFFADGKVSEVMNWKNGIREGSWETCYSDGKTKMKGAYRSGEKSGPFVFYYTNGTIMMSGDYLEGHQHGTWLYYSDKGEVVRTEKYDKGILIDKKLIINN